MDSDDEYERRPRGRDKFRRERSDYQDRSDGRRDNNRSGGGGGGNRRDDSWQDNRRGRQQQWDNNQRRNRDNYGGGGGRHHDGGGPPMKRQRRDWDNQGYNQQQGGDYGGYNNQANNQWPLSMDNQQQSFQNQQQTDANIGPVMLTFKQFLNSQADDIEDMEAVRKYQEYKLEFRKTQIADFFTSHKDEEWFRNKYHPGDALAYQKRLNNGVKKRASVFIDLLQSGWFDKFTLTVDQGEEITKLLDAAVIKFEGGTDFDLQVLDGNYKEAELANKENKNADGMQETDSGSQQTNEKNSIEEKGVSPVSPSSVPLPETPAPATSSAKPIDNQSVENKPSESADSSLETTKKDRDEEKLDKKDETSDGKPCKKKRRHRDNYYSDDNAESESESDSETEPAPPGEESAKSDAKERASEENLHPPGVESVSSDEVMKDQGGDFKDIGKKASKTVSKENVPEKVVEKNESEQHGNEIKQVSGDQSETAEAKTTQGEEHLAQTTNIEQGEAEPENMDTSEDLKEKGDEKDRNNDQDSVVEPKITTPRPLHLTVSLFVRNVPPKISHNDIDSLCARYPGYMRAVLSDPTPDKKFSRRGWITFKPDVNIKDICWSLNNIKLKDVELNPMVNRELAKRIRTVSGAAVLKGWVESDITMATRLIVRLDEKFRVWKPEEKSEAKIVETPKQEETTEEKSEEQNVEESPPESDTPATESDNKPPKIVPKIDLPESNPVLNSIPQNISEKLATISENQVENKGDIPECETSESSKVPGSEGSEHPPPEIDEDLVKLLDRLILYLRIVHSLDYYSGAEYLYEDDMPNRCGIVHIRSPLPDKVNYEEVTEWHKNLHQKLDQHLQKKNNLADDEADQLGKKNQEQEVEKFVQANTQELAKDKWLCPLSGKKFRGPEFVRKHIFNKHGDKVEDVKTEVAFFNNFVYDPCRPSEIVVKAPGPGTHIQSFQGGMSHQTGVQNNQGGWGRGGGMHYGNRGGYNQYGGSFRSDHYNNRGGFQKQRRGSFGGGQRHDSRPIVQYRDLDAPGDDNDFF